MGTSGDHSGDDEPHWSRIGSVRLHGHERALRQCHTCVGCLELPLKLQDGGMDCQSGHTLQACGRTLFLSAHGTVHVQEVAPDAAGMGNDHVTLWREGGTGLPGQTDTEVSDFRAAIFVLNQESTSQSLLVIDAHVSHAKASHMLQTKLCSEIPGSSTLDRFPWKFYAATTGCSKRTMKVFIVISGKRCSLSTGRSWQVRSRRAGSTVVSHLFGIGGTRSKLGWFGSWSTPLYANMERLQWHRGSLRNRRSMNGSLCDIRLGANSTYGAVDRATSYTLFSLSVYRECGQSTASDSGKAFHDSRLDSIEIRTSESPRRRTLCTLGRPSWTP
ncbi:hypothetical protein BDZ85DRAFT_298944 [Elsinoe ampelina]|uniref:Uncharacterized protein n=1 Tax=Elsinoe ampelina TaxID=302913 RepID=A0A6A6G0X5_9PEZI|nr:hypothetical protein BDZ85DRAFT_298944 [Elsinoe ampelina]